MIFVFGSNLRGFHGAGAAKRALDVYGAIPGQGEGRQGDSYAIPTKNKMLHSLRLPEVHNYVRTFIEYAEDHPGELFKVTAVGTGYAGFLHEQMAPLFANCPDNCYFDEAWKPILGERKRYWGTYPSTSEVE